LGTTCREAPSAEACSRRSAGSHHPRLRAGAAAGQSGTIAGLFYGVSFGLGALSAALPGELADITSIATVYRLCAFLPL